MFEEIKELVKIDCEAGIKYKKISEKYNVSIGTIKSWVHREKWAVPKKSSKIILKVKQDNTNFEKENSKRKSSKKYNVQSVLEKHLYSIWNSMKQRCNNPNDNKYVNYGGRGIKVYDKWNQFKEFYKDMGKTYFKHCLEYGTFNTSIDRIDVNGNYEPSNCRWATQKEQANNKRNNVKININGKSLRLKKLCEKYNLDYYTMLKINSLTKRN